MKKELNKWQIIFHLKNCMEYLERKEVFRFGIFNIHTFPQEGESLSKECYKGFIIQWKFWHPLTILKRYLENKKY